MLQMSKILRSRDEWRKKAIQRADEVRELKKTKRRHQCKIAELKAQLGELNPANKKTEVACECAALLPSASGATQAEQTRALCILLVLRGIVSYRSTPRILRLFDAANGLTTNWIPHFTSVINWVLRVGLGLLEQVKPIACPWVAIIDHSIDIGTKKALVVLRVRLDTLERKDSALQFQDCECVGLRIDETVNGDSVALALGEIFQRSGAPVAILKDCDRTLNKGVCLWQAQNNTAVAVIDDIGHVMAAAMKQQFEDSADYRTFTTLVSSGAKHLRQTALAFLTPPKLRTKGRFLGISRLGRWGEKLLSVFCGAKDAEHGKMLDKLHAALPDFDNAAPFIRRFADTAKVVSQVMEALKHKGLNPATSEQCRSLAATLPDDSPAKQRLSAWLARHMPILQQLACVSLPVSSDIIESLFGRFKYMLERNPQADMNRSALLIPVLCANLDETIIRQALSNADHRALETWEQRHIPYTQRKKRREFFSCTQPETGEALGGACG